MSGRRWPALLALVSVAAILLAVNALADRFLGDAQVDLTHGGLYTLSPGTRQVLAGLREPVTLRLFYSRRLGAGIPAFASYADQVHAVLRRYAGVSRGMLQLEFYDPEPFSDVEDRAVSYGLQGVPLDRTGEQVYFGLVGTNMVGDQRSVAFLQPSRARFLDYDLTRTILALSNPKRPVVGAMSPLPLDGDSALALRGLPGGAPWLAMTQLREAFDVRRVALDTTSIDPAIEVLMVAHPQGLGEATLYAIDQFVMRGGRLLALVDPHSEAEAALPDAGQGKGSGRTASDLHRLLSAWGVDFDPEQVVGDLDGAWRLQTGASGQGSAVAYPPWFNLGQRGIARDDPATGDLDQVTVAAAGFLRQHPGVTGSFTPLLQSSVHAALIPAQQVRDQPDPAAILAAFQPQGGPFTLAGRLHGMLRSAFNAPPAGTAASLPAYVPATAAPANLVVVADSDLLADRFWVREQDYYGQTDPVPFSDNGAFVINLVGTLAGGDALLGLRARGGMNRPFTRIDAMQAAADAKFQTAEQQLRTQLDATRKRLDDLRHGHAATGEATRALVNAEQQRAIDELTREVADNQGKLRAVQRGLRADIEHLEGWVRLLDIAGVPVLLLAGIAAAAMLRRRASARPAA